MRWMESRWIMTLLRLVRGPDLLLLDELSRAVGTRDQHLVLSLIDQASSASAGRINDSFAEQFQRVLPALKGVAPPRRARGHVGRPHRRIPQPGHGPSAARGASRA